MQKPDWHCTPLLHGAPGPCVPTQAPATQANPGLQPSASHAPAHRALPSHQAPPHSDSGSSPAAWGTHVPTEPGWLHASQLPAHALPQHTPSAQWPDSHCASTPQPSPSARNAAHRPPTHPHPAAHPAALVQPVAQPLAPLQA